ncbi:MAG: hypothetical protein MUD06_05925 [Rhodospirillales bacterium]|jgi:hypothetical protein|nr:hypothetical protein [Rhodospirillales bacterium]
MKKTLAVAAGLMLAGLVASGNVGAATHAALSPELQKEVSARVARGERYEDVVSTLVMNEAARRYPQASFFRIVPEANAVLVALPDNTMRTVAYDPATLKLKP